MDSSKKFKIYNGLNKGDKIDIKYDSAVARGSEYRTFVVIKGKFKVGKQKIERVTLRLEDNPRGVKFYLYNRNKNVQMAIGDMAASIVDMKPSSNESVNEGKSLADMKKSANKFKKELAQLKKDLKKSPNNTSIEGRKEAKEEQLRRVASAIRNARADKHESVNEATSKITMNNLDWGKSTSERNSNLDKYNSLKTDKEKETFKRKLKNESVNEGIEAFDERHVSNHTIIMLRNGNETRSLIFKKGVENKYNRNNKKDLETMWGLAKKFGQKPITEADGEEPQVIQDIRWVLDNKQNKKVKDPKTGKAMRVDLYSSSAIIKVYDALSKSSREKYVASGIPKMAGMAFKLLK